MTIEEIVLIIAVPILIAIPLSITLYIWFQHKKALEAFNANFKPLSTIIPASYWDLSNDPNMQTRLSSAFNMAHYKLKAVWPNSLIVQALSNLKVQVMVTDSFVSAEGQKVAGLSHLDIGMVTVGHNLEALCHELIHMLEDRLEGSVTYDHASWSPAKWKACDDYIADLRTTNGTGALNGRLRD